MSESADINKYVVFGARGFIGKNLIESLVANGAEIIAVSRLWSDEDKSIDSKNVTYVNADLSSVESYCEVIDERSIVVDLAYDGLKQLGANRYVEDVKNNVLPHVKLFELCAQKSVRGLVFVSSGGTVYGDLYGQAIGEHEKCSPMTSYACTKLALEHFLKSICEEKNVNYMVIRPSNPYGKYQNSKCGVGLIARTIDSVYTGDVLRVFGDGSLVRDYIHISDLCDGMVRLMNTPDAYCEVYNIGNCVGHSINDIIKLVEKISNLKMNVAYGDCRSTDIRYNVLDCDKLKNAINWMPKYSLEQGIDEICDEMNKCRDRILKWTP